MKVSQLKQIIREEISKVLNESSDDAQNFAKHIAGPFESDIVPGSCKFTYGPNEEGSYHLEFQLKFDGLDGHTTDEFEEELQQQIGGSSSGGPGQAFSRTYVSYKGEKGGNYLFIVYSRGGFDI